MYEPGGPEVLKIEEVPLMMPSATQTFSRDGADIDSVPSPNQSMAGCSSE